MVMDVSDGQGSTELGLGLPVTLNQTPSNHATSCAPQVGEHSHAVLKEFGFSDQEITELQEAQVISQH
jgi:crotonobetainyl-CoA:carnitine CoA-transferase CaiB-like acyl-CoA transferase